MRNAAWSGGLSASSARRLAAKSATGTATSARRPAGCPPRRSAHAEAPAAAPAAARPRLPSHPPSPRPHGTPPIWNRRSPLARLWGGLRSTQGSYGVDSGAIRCRIRVQLGECGVGVNLGWVHLGSIWVPSGVHLGWIRSRSGVGLGSIRGRAGVNLGPIWAMRTLCGVDPGRFRVGFGVVRGPSGRNLGSKSPASKSRFSVGTQPRPKHPLPKWTLNAWMLPTGPLGRPLHTQKGEKISAAAFGEPRLGEGDKLRSF